jgi:AcrR family transcriptional regulator
MPEKKVSTKAPVKTGTRKKRSPQEIRDRLLNAARTEFRRCGYVGATTASIARQAEVTDAQLFRYFDTKADLFREAVFDPLDKHFAEFVHRYMADIPNMANVRDRARIYIAELQQFIGEHSKLLMALVMSELFSTGNLDGLGDIKGLHTYFDHSAFAMRSRVDKAPRVDPKLLVRVSFAAVLGCVMFKDLIFPRGLDSDENISEALIDFVISGLDVNLREETRLIKADKKKRK